VEICPLTKAKCPEVKDMDFLEKILVGELWSLVVIKVVEPNADEQRESLAKVEAEAVAEAGAEAGAEAEAEAKEAEALRE